MPFKFRDLIVDVVSEGVQNLGPVRCITLTCANFTCGFVSPVTCYTHTCGFISKWGCRWSCGFFSPDPCGGFTGCPAGSGDPCGGSVWQGDPIRELGVLKQQLQEQLAQVEQLEKTQAEAARPKTLQEAEDLERRLKGALEELQAMKQNLR
ncbi:MAG TPA: hypothetical protein VJ725_12780 [Thermoanaerobaculia bacterium]|nr:hypothetical protein [Thermoanaerobaculia bacterium]